MDENAPPKDILFNEGLVMGSSDTVLVGLRVCTSGGSWGTGG